MRMRSVLAGTAAAAVAAGVALASATGAWAGDLGSATFACGPGTDTVIAVNGDVGDTFTIQSTAPQDCSVTSSTAGIVAWTTDDPFGSRFQDPEDFYGSLNFPATPYVGTTVTFTMLAAGSTTWVARQTNGIVISFTIGGASSETLIPAWVQAYGRASAQTRCQEGWGASWQSWAEQVTGGWVCTRTIPSLG